MHKSTQKNAAYILYVFLALAASYVPQAVLVQAAPTYTTWSGPPYALVSANATLYGYFRINGTARFASFTTTGTGGLGDFSRFTVNGVYEWPRIGFGCDSVNQTCTITALTRRELTYLPSDVTTVVRVWSPDNGEPESVTDGTLVWDPVWSVSTITPINGGPITVTWNVVADAAFGEVYKYIWIVGLMPMVSAGVMIIAALSGNLNQDNVKPILGLVVGSLVVTLILYAITA